jgi:hypothetical protein
MRYCTLAVLGAVLLSLGGCSGKTTPNSNQPAAQSPAITSPAANSAPRTQAIAVPANATPDYVLTVFLGALRTGDSATVESLLTTKARQELAKHQLSVDVVSAENATYQVRTPEILPTDPNGAHVSSVWTEKFDDGEETYEIVWALRRQPDGWRLAGMAMELIPGKMDFLNFENPEDMLRKKDEAIAAMQPPAAETAQQPPPGTPAQQSSVER